MKQWLWLSLVALVALAALAVPTGCTRESRPAPSSTSSVAAVPDGTATPPALAPRTAANDPHSATAPLATPLGASSMAEGRPWVLHFESLSNAWLENASAEPQYLLHSQNFQPSRLRLFGKDGSELTASDARARKKFDNRVSRADYVEVPPHGKAPLFQGRIKDYAGSYELVWGPFSFTALAPGSYQATLEWQSERQDYTDESGAQKTLSSVWLGTLQTPRFTVNVP